MKWQDYKEHLTSKHSSPHELALGFAVGTFIGIFPTPFLSLLLALFALFLYPKMSKATLLGAIILWNPLITIPLSVVSYKIGDMLFGAAPVVEYTVPLMTTIGNFTRRFLIGNVILSTIGSLIGYSITYTLATIWQKHHHKD